MRNVNDCISSFTPLLSTEYEIFLGRKSVAVKLIITFDKKDCFHLMGLQYLVDRPELSRDREKIFDAIKSGVITREQIESSDFYHKIQDRVHFLPLLEQMLDSNDTVFKYNQHLFHDRSRLFNEESYRRTQSVLIFVKCRERPLFLPFFLSGRKNRLHEKASFMDFAV